MNKSFKFLALSLLMVPAASWAMLSVTEVTRYLKESYVGKLVVNDTTRCAAQQATDHTVEFFKGVAAAAVVNAGVGSLKAKFPDAAKNITFVHDAQTGQYTAVLALGALSAADALNPSTEKIGWSRWGARTAGMLASSYTINAAKMLMTSLAAVAGKKS